MFTYEFATMMEDEASVLHTISRQPTSTCLGNNERTTCDIGVVDIRPHFLISKKTNMILKCKNRWLSCLVDHHNHSCNKPGLFLESQHVKLNCLYVPLCWYESLYSRWTCVNRLLILIGHLYRSGVRLDVDLKIETKNTHVYILLDMCSKLVDISRFKSWHNWERPI